MKIWTVMPNEYYIDIQSIESMLHRYDAVVNLKD